MVILFIFLTIVFLIYLIINIFRFTKTGDNPELKKKIGRKILISAILAVVFFCLPIIFLSILWTRPTDYCNCVVVADESHFTGKLMKYSQAEKHARIKISECEKFDLELDNGDGPEAGKVRWINCLSGPDCDEAGMH